MSTNSLSPPAELRKNTRLLFFGSDPISMPFLEQLVTDGWSLSGLVTLSAAARGRGWSVQENIVAEAAQKYHLPVFTPGSREEITTLVKEINPLLCLVVAYGKILPLGALGIPRFGFVNIHPSLLPHWRGPAPITAALLDGDKKTGVSFMLLDAEMDHGPLLAQYEIEIDGQDTVTTLEKKLIELARPKLSLILEQHVLGQLPPQEQKHDAATYSKKLKRADGLLDQRLAAETLARRVRALAGWPGTFVLLQDKRLKVLRAHTSRVAPAKGGEFGLACKDSSWLILDEVQPEGKRPMSGSAFLRGHKM